MPIFISLLLLHFKIESLFILANYGYVVRFSTKGQQFNRLTKDKHKSLLAAIDPT